LREQRIVGISKSFVENNRFQFTDKNKSWYMLDLVLSDGRIPVIGDYNTVVWLLGGDVGSVFEIKDEAGCIRRLEVVAILDTTIFTGTFFMAEKNIDILFPTTADYRYFLVKINGSKKIDARTVAQQLEIKLNTFGVNAIPIQQIVAENIKMEHTYISMFRVYLWLGLGVGIVGLCVLMIRAVKERKREIGIMRAIGFKRSGIFKLFLLESSIISIAGIVTGVLAGILTAYISFNVWSGGTDGNSIAYFQIPLLEIFLIGCSIYIISILSALFPAFKASALPPADALRIVE
jgi:putative ABC transport system permease protein